MKRFAFGQKKSLVAYLCVGDPDESESVALALACVRVGADILELGVPFSDPTADGPAIERASRRSLAKGGGLDSALRVATKIRTCSNVPIVLFGYYNPIFVRGEKKVVQLAAEAGIDAFLVVDLPIEEGSAFRSLAGESGIGLVPLVTPTTRPERVALIKDLAHVPFVYYVSMTGVTGGAGSADVLDLASVEAAKVRAVTGKPTVVGFGIDSGARAKQAAAKADGVVVGSAIVRRIEEGCTPEQRVASVEALVRELRSAF